MTDDQANLESLKKIQKSSNHQLWATRNKSEATKVDKAIKGERHTRPSSLYAQGLVEIADRSHVSVPMPPPTPGPTPPPINPTPPPIPTPDPQPWDSGYAPQSYNQGTRGQDARYNIRINCTRVGDNDHADKNNVHYDDGGLCRGGRTGNSVPGLKPADMMDGLEPWEPYEWQGKQIPPYPDQSYDK